MADELDPRVRRTRADVVAAAGRILLDDGWDSVTHARVASKAGYSRATLYRHWRDQADLIELALEHVNGVAHTRPTGDVGADLVTELNAFRVFLVHRGFGPVLAGLAHHAATDERLKGMRDHAIRRGLRVVTALIEQAHQQGRLHPALDVPTATAMLTGGLIHEVVVSGHAPGRDFVERCVASVLV